MQIQDNVIRRAEARTPAQRFTTAAIVAAIHLGAITALIVGLNVKIEKIIPAVIDARVIPQKQTKVDEQPKLPPVALDQPPKPTIPKPFIDIKPDKPGTTITADVGPKGFYRSTEVAGLLDTHSTPPYPPSARRLGREGVVLLKLTISPLGIVTAVEIEKSSGYAELDRTAAEWVETHWRYRAATVEGHPVVSTAEASVRFSLKETL